MAAAVSSAWAKKPGAWALDSEEHEAELKNETLTAVNGDTAEFPSLTAAVTTKTKKKKPQAMSLSEFGKSKNTHKTFTLTRDENVSLPTGPRERTAEELENGGRLGGGFRSYGSNRGSDEPRKREVRESMGSSRADEVDDWGSTKRPVERRERGFFGGSDSKADESDNWGSNKSFVPSEGRRFDGGRGRGEREEREERGFFGGSESKADESDNWGANKSFVPSSEGRRRVGFGLSGVGDRDDWGKRKEEEGGRRLGGMFDSLRDRRGGFDSSDSDNWGKKREEGGMGSDRVDRPRLKLQPRTVPVGEQNGSVVAAVAEVVVAKPKGSNPFGEARPREEVLKEKGKDWKEIDEKLDAMKVKEAEVASFGKRVFGGSNGGGNMTEVRGERSWRKPDSDDIRPQSAEKVENDVAEEAQDLLE